MPITLNHSNIGIQYSTGSNYIIETVKSDLYLRNEIVDTIVRDNIQTAPVTPIVSIQEGSNIYAVESYTYSGTANTADFTRVFPKNTTCDILIIGGGGGGGKRHGGGGGAGTLLYHKNIILNGTYNIKVGKGGAGHSPSITTTTSTALDGNFSQFVKSDGTQNYYAVGGGRGTGSLGPPNPAPHVYANTNGGQGFLYDANITLSPNNIFNGVPVAVSNKQYVNTLPLPEGCRGNIGGIQINDAKGGGGGGAGGAGMNHGEESTLDDGYGGLGLAIDITGKSVVYAGGGNGTAWNGSVAQVFDPAYPTIESRGGGGFGSDNGTPQNGLDGTGGGGGAQGSDTNGIPSGSGGSGIVIIRYLLGTIPSNNILSTEPTVISPAAFTESIRTFAHSGGTEAQTTHTITVGQNTICDILIVGGGGGGGKTDAGGGGAGGLIYVQNIILTGTYDIKVGKGGLGGTSASTVAIVGDKGGNTSFIGTNANYVAYGGGGGGYGHPSDVEPSNLGPYGSSGGLGTSDQTRESFNVNTPGQGYLGGLGTAAEGGGGGGGSGGQGINSGNGGIGTQINITGTNLYYAGGGGGGHNPSGTSGGLGGGGSATFYGGNNATFYGGGGGGGGANWGNGGNGFSGVVIIKFKSTTNASILDGITHKRLNFAYNSDNLVAWYKFNGDYLDSSGNGHNLTNVGTVIQSTHIIEGQAVEFDSTDYLEFPATINPYTIWNGKGITFSFWIRITSITGTYSRFIDFQSAASSSSGIFFAFNGAGTQTFYLDCNGTTLEYNNNSITTNLGVWHHILWCIDKTGKWDVYLNNLRINNTQTSTVSNITYNLRYINKSTYTGNGVWGGQMDDFRIYDRALSAADVSLLYNKTYLVPPNTYTLNFPVPTIADINNNNNILLRGEYDISLSTANSSIIPKSNQYIPPPTTFSTSNISIRYNLLNPTLDPIGAQWTYNTSNTNVYHMGNVGIGTKSPEYHLDVRGFIHTSVGGYTQTGSENWIIQSDRRIKENIVKASYDKCLENVKNIELYNFNFKDNCVNTNDRHQLGFIAQEVQQVYPKAVEVGKIILDNNQGINDLLTLNTTQIKYTLYGAVKNLIERVENIESRVEQIYNMTLSSNFKSPSSNISISIINTSNMTVNTSNIATNTSNINTSNVAVSSSNIAVSTSNVAVSTSNIATNTSNIAVSTSNVAMSTSNIAVITSNVAVSTSNVAVITSNVSVSTSNIAVITSNVAVSTSNVAVITSNVSVSTSNIAVITSNVAVSTSNISVSTSNIATNTSNIATNTSNVSVSTSNVAVSTSNVAVNTSNIAASTSNIDTSNINTSNVAVSTSNIAVITSNITANTSNINTSNV
jgi:hypothetical protein